MRLSGPDMPRSRPDMRQSGPAPRSLGCERSGGKGETYRGWPAPACLRPDAPRTARESRNALAGRRRCQARCHPVWPNQESRLLLSTMSRDARWNRRATRAARDAQSLRISVTSA